MSSAVFELGANPQAVMQKWEQFVDWFINDPVVERTMVEKVVDPLSNAMFITHRPYEMVAPVLAVALFSTLYFVIRYRVEAFLIHVARKRGVHSPDARKFAECGFYVAYYVVAITLGSLVLWADGWDLWTSTNFWVDWPAQPFPRFFRVYYLAELSFYVHAIVFTTWFDTRRSDFVELVTHHAATIALIALSYFFFFFRVGLAILLLHNIADIFLYATKVAYYWNYRNGLLKDILFGVFALSFFGTRLVFFPVHVLYSTWYEVGDIRGFESIVHACLLFNVLLWTLQLLHVFWFALITRMLWRLWKKGEVEKDIRSDDDESVDSSNSLTDNSSVASETSSKSGAAQQLPKSKTLRRKQVHRRLSK